MLKLIKGPHLETLTNNSRKCHYILSPMLSYLPEQVTYAERNTSAHEYMKTQIIGKRMSEHITFYVERNANAQLYMKPKLYVSGRRSTSYTTFEARPLESMIGDDNNDVNSVNDRTTDRNAVICHAIMQMTRVTLRYVKTRVPNSQYLV
ncbi:hypothetical protein HanIR_Chr02g0062441 [Helianthus annuus]|nr:hypothetical protein HanIR_Chr02g0062441 [Helianthus annuus]